MTLQKITTRNTVLVLMIVAAAAFRLLSFKYKELSNFTPVGAIALFGGAYFTEKWKAYFVPLVTLFLSDILVNYLYTSKWVLWYSGSIWVYLTFAIMVFIGSYIKNIKQLLSKFTKGGHGYAVGVAFASLASILVHWLIIDLPWLYGTLYAHTLSGYWQSLVAAIPFERNMILGDIVFCAILFGGFELAKRKYTFLRTNREVAL